MIYKLLFILSWVYILFGVIGIFRFDNLYARLLTSSKIDTAASTTIIMALMFHSGFNKVSAKLFVILLFIIATTPIGSHVIARSAYYNGIALKGDHKEL